MKWHPNGQLREIAYGNDLYTEFAEGTDGMHRVEGITVFRPLEGPDEQVISLSPIQYDEAGNVWGVAGDRFNYDTNSRLVKARFWADGQQYTARYAFDKADNIVEHGRANGDSTDVLPIEVDAATKPARRKREQQPVQLFLGQCRQYDRCRHGD